MPVETILDFKAGAGEVLPTFEGFQLKFLTLKVEFYKFPRGDSEIKTTVLVLKRAMVQSVWHNAPSIVDAKCFGVWPNFMQIHP